MSAARGDSGMRGGMSLGARLGLALALTFTAVACLLLPWIDRTSREAAEETLQQVNRDVARAVVEHAELFAEGAPVEKEIRGVFMKLMAVNPNLELYLLDADGRILAYDAPEGVVQAERVDLAPVEKMLAGAEGVVHGTDPRHPDAARVFTVWPVDRPGGRDGYVYAVVGGDAYRAVADGVYEGTAVRRGVLVAGGVLALAALVAFGLVLYLTRDLRRLRTSVRAFRDGDVDARSAVRRRDEIGRLAEDFNDLAETVVAQLERIRGADDERREMVAGISHDLHTPLSTLRGFLERLQERADALSPEERAEMLGLARRNTERTLRMVDDLFELASLEAPNLRLQREDFHLGELVQDVVQRHRATAEEHGQTLEMEVEGKLPPVDGDIALIERALTNLIVNAVRHTPEGGSIRLSVAAREHSVEVRVADTGSGIDAAELPRIFDRFYRVDKSRPTGAASGIGLGLAIVQRILALHGGAIGVQSTPGKGTEFRFTLPARVAAPAEPASA